MKLVIFDGTFKTTAFINRLIQGLVKQSVEVYVLGFNEVVNEKINGVQYVGLGNSNSSIKFAITSLKWGIKSSSLFKTAKLLVKAKKTELKQNNLTAALQHIQPDIVHVQWVSNIGLFEKHLQKGKCKYILSQRGFQTNVRPFVNKENFAYLQDWLPKFDGFHSVSKAISKQGDKIYSHPEKRDHVVYTGLEVSKFQFQSQVNKNKVLQLISVGRPHWIKGYEYAIKACSILRQKGIDFHYTIVGAKGNEELLFLITDLGLSNKVKLTDKLPQQEVFIKMSNSDICLLPSLEEGIANVVVEAMALGTPVISTDCGGMQELIVTGKEGWIVPARDAKAMADQIIAYMDYSEEELKQLKLKARKKVEQQHSEEKMISDMMHLYKEVYGLD